jgi:hypothetical protein
VTYRLAGRAEDVIDGILLESARRWGVPTAAKYNRLILAALTAIGDSPAPLARVTSLLSPLSGRTICGSPETLSTGNIGLPHLAIWSSTESPQTARLRYSAWLMTASN